MDKFIAKVAKPLRKAETAVKVLKKKDKVQDRKLASCAKGKKK